jgi:hypothetical protein
LNFFGGLAYIRQMKPEELRKNVDALYRAWQNVRNIESSLVWERKQRDGRREDLDKARALVVRSEEELLVAKHEAERLEALFDTDDDRVTDIDDGA